MDLNRFGEELETRAMAVERERTAPLFYSQNAGYFECSQLYSAIGITATSPVLTIRNRVTPTANGNQIQVDSVRGSSLPHSSHRPPLLTP